jgi:hypothetical protein
MNIHTDLTTLRGTVVAIAPAPAANRSGKIKLQSGEILYAFPEKLKLVQAGGAYEFGVEPYVKEGKQFLNVKTLANLDPIKPNPNFIQPEEIAAQRRSPTQPQNAPAKASAKPDSNGFGSNNYRPTHPRDARRMFLTATLGHYIETGRVDLKAQAIGDAMVEILQAYDSVIGREE